MSMQENLSGYPSPEKTVILGQNPTPKLKEPLEENPLKRNFLLSLIYFNTYGPTM